MYGDLKPVFIQKFEKDEELEKRVRRMIIFLLLSR
jgi:hypothetical protein